MDLLRALIVVSEKAANVARLCRQDSHLFHLLIQKKSVEEANPRFVDDFKTLADVLIQELVKYDIGNRFPQLRNAIKGEETNSFSNQLGETIQVEIKESVQDTAFLLQKVLNEDREAADLLATEVHRVVVLEEVPLDRVPDEDFTLQVEDLGIWIDPIDSTAEYISGGDFVASGGISTSGLSCVTVLIGVYDKNSGVPIMGVVNQPFVCYDGGKWTGTCFWGSPTSTSLRPLSTSPSTGTVCVSSSEDLDVITRLKSKGGYTVTEASGAGYKILSVLTGLADAYILTRDSTFKWDTCGPQAILRGLGGDVVVYNEAITHKRVISVEYRGNNKGNCGGIIAYGKLAVLNDIIDCLTKT